MTRSRYRTFTPGCRQSRCEGPCAAAEVCEGVLHRPETGPAHTEIVARVGRETFSCKRIRSGDLAGCVDARSGRRGPGAVSGRSVDAAGHSGAGVTVGRAGEVVGQYLRDSVHAEPPKLGRGAGRIAARPEAGPAVPARGRGAGPAPRAGRHIDDEVLAHISPARSENINLHVSSDSRPPRLVKSRIYAGQSRRRSTVSVATVVAQVACRRGCGCPKSHARASWALHPGARPSGVQARWCS